MEEIALVELFICSECKETYTSALDLQQHFRTAHSTMEEQCHLCKALFPNRRERDLHLACTHGYPYACSQCGMQFYVTADLLIHKTTEHIPSPVCCRACRKERVQNDWGFTLIYINHVYEKGVLYHSTSIQGLYLTEKVVVETVESYVLGVDVLEHETHQSALERN